MTVPNKLKMNYLGIINVTILIYASVATVSSCLTCDFEDGTMCGFTQSTVDDFDWRRHTGSTSSGGTGPSSDHTGGGYYMYIEASSPRSLGDTARLVGPIIHQAPGSKTQVQFWYHMYGSAINTLNVYTTTDIDEYNTEDIEWTMSGDQGNQWHMGNFTINSSSAFQVSFEGIRGRSYKGDISLDDITIWVNSTGPGIYGCNNIRESVELGQNDTTVWWSEPRAFDTLCPSGMELNTTSISHRPGTEFPVGRTSVSYIYAIQDQSVNQITCDFIILIEEVDTTPPIVSQCPSELRSIAGRYVTWIEPTATDLSGHVTLSGSHAPGIYMETTPVVYTFTDSSGNAAFCNFIVNISIDIVPPVIIGCPSDINASAEIEEPGTSVSWIKPSADDEFGRVMLIDFTHTSGERFPVGTTSVVYTFADDSFNKAYCNFSVIIRRDNTENNTEKIETTTEKIETTTETVSWNEQQKTNVSANVTSGACIPTQFTPYTHTPVKYVFVDDSENEEVCEFYATFDTVDTTPPTIISCPSDISITVETGISYSSVWWSTPLATDSPGPMITHSTHEPGQRFHIGSTMVVYHFEDESSNQAECIFTVNVENVDTIPPGILFCPVDISETIELGISNKTVFWREPSASDVSGNVLTSQSHFPGDYFPIGKTDVHYTFVDSTENGASCNFSILLTSVDNTAPDILMCPFDITTTIEVGTIGTVVSWIEPIAMDESGNATLLLNTHSPGQMFAVGSAPVIYIFTDNSKNMAVCRFSIIINNEDTAPPTIACCPSDIHLIAENGTPEIPASWIEPSASDASGHVTLINVTHAPGDNFTVGSTTVKYTFADDSDNSASCEFMVAVSLEDTIPPEIVDCPSDLHISTEIETSEIPVSWIEPSASDASGYVRLVNVTHAPGDNFTVGSTTVKYTFVDDSDNSASCEFMVEVSIVDTKTPTVMNCPGNIITNIEPGTYGSVVHWTEPEAVDESGVVTLLVKSHSSGAYFPVGTTMVTYLYKDKANNIASCMFSVTRTTAPLIFNCPSNVNISIESGQQQTRVAWMEPSAIDLSGYKPMVSRSHKPNDLFRLGTTTMIVYVFEDGNGNQAMCNFSVNVIRNDTISSSVQHVQSHIKTSDGEPTHSTLVWISVAALGLTLLSSILLLLISGYIYYIRNKDNTKDIEPDCPDITNSFPAPFPSIQLEMDSTS